MIHSARPIVTPVVNIVFCCFVFLYLKSGDGCTDGQLVQKQLSLPAVTLGWPSGSIMMARAFSYNHNFQTFAPLACGITH